MRTTIIRRLPPATPEQRATLTAHQRRVYDALRTEGLTQSALAERDGTTESSVGVTVHRIAAKLGHISNGHASAKVTALRQAKALPVLDPKTEEYTDDGGHRMLWLVRASEKYGFPVSVLRSRGTHRLREIHCQHRLVSDPTAAVGKVLRAFVRESECPGLKAWWDSYQQYAAAATAARARGLKPALEVAKALGVSTTRVHPWCNRGCNRLSNRAKPVHEWIGPFGDRKQELWISSKSVREIKAAPQYRYIDQPDGRYIDGSEAERRCKCIRWTLTLWATGTIPVPGGGKFRRSPGPGGAWYYHEGDVNAVTRVKKSGRSRRVPGPLRGQWPTKAGLALPTSRVAELCGVALVTAYRWGHGRSTEGGLKLRPAGKASVRSRRLQGWRADDAVAIARARGRQIPADLNEAYPANGNGHKPGRTAKGLVTSGTAEANSTKPKFRRGRPPGTLDTDPAFDKRVSDAWDTGEYGRSKARLAREFDITESEARRALDRHRKRLKGGADEAGASRN